MKEKYDLGDDSMVNQDQISSVKSQIVEIIKTRECQVVRIDDQLNVTGHSDGLLRGSDLIINYGPNLKASEHQFNDLADELYNEYGGEKQFDLLTVEAWERIEV